MKQHHLAPEQVDRLPGWFEARYRDYSAIWDEVVTERRQS